MANQRLYKLIGYNLINDKMDDDSPLQKTGLVFDSSLPIDYEDFCTIENVDKYYKIGLNYLQARNVLQTLLIGIVLPDFSLWDNLSINEKFLICKWGLAPYSLRVTSGILTDEQDYIYFKTLLEETAGYRKDILYGRRHIVEEMRQFIGLGVYRQEIIIKSDIDNIYESTTSILEAYIASNNPAFKYWLNNTVGTPYETNGFANKTYYNVDIKNALNTIMTGDY